MTDSVEVTTHTAHYLALCMKRVHLEPEGCWLWQGPVTKGGYGQVGIMRRNYLAHRWFYAHFVGPIPDGLQIDHLCRVRNCVNPSHLEPVTARVNTLRAPTVSGLNATKTECVNGHEFTPDNTYDRPTGGRGCRECRRHHTRQWNAKRRLSR